MQSKFSRKETAEWRNQWQYYSMEREREVKWRHRVERIEETGPVGAEFIRP